jgi:PAS domain S-box-containing protein
LGELNDRAPVTRIDDETAPALGARPLEGDRRALAACGILDTPADPVYDGIAETLALACNAPVALVSFADGARQWFKAKVGLDLSEIPTEQSFCRFTLGHDDRYLEVPDATQDARFADNPYVVGPPGVRFYAGARIELDDGARIGTLCVIDVAPRDGLTPGQRSSLETLARLIAAELGQRRTNRALVDTLAELNAARDAERAAAQERDLMRRVVEATSDGVWVTRARPDPRNQPIVYANPGFGRMMGLPVEDLLGQSPKIMHGPDSDPAVLGHVSEMVDRGRSTRVEVVCYRADGETFWNDVTVNPIEGPDGTPSHWIGINRDVTARRHMQQALQRRKDDLKLLFEANPVPMYVFDVETLRFIEVNAAAKDHYGYGEAWRTMTLLDLYPPDDHDEVIHRVRTREPSGLQQVGRWRHRTAEGREIIVDLRSHRLDYAGRPAALAAAIDVTDQLRAESSAQQARLEAERANKAKSEFLAHMSHELRTPLNAIMGLSETMTLELFGPLGTARYRDYADDVLGAARHLLTLINEVLDLSKIEAGQRDLTPAPTALGDVLDGVRLLVSGRSKERGVAIDDRAARGAPVLDIDAQAMRQVLTNLVDNAVKFSPAGGTVRIEAGRTTEGGARIAVVDDGPGMTRSEAQEAVQPFRQNRVTARTEEHGVGLGLPIAARLVELHGGTLTLDSAPGKGTRAIIDLPAACIAPAGTRSAPAPRRASG